MSTSSAKRKTATTVFLMFGLLIIVLNTVYVVKQTEQSLVLRFGKPIKVIKKPGLAFKMPFVENVEMFEKRLLTFNAQPQVITAKDDKRLIVDAFVRYKITDPLKFKQTVGYEREMGEQLDTMLNSALRQGIGGASLIEVISSKRHEVMQQVKELVNRQAQGQPVKTEEGTTKTVAPRGGFGIEVVDVRIIRTDLPEDNSDSIYKRMRTEREEEAANLRAQGAEEAQKITAKADKERTILLANARKTSEILRGEGDKESVRIFASAVKKSPEFYDFYRSLQAYQKTITSDNTTVILSPESQFLKYMDRR